MFTTVNIQQQRLNGVEVAVTATCEGAEGKDMAAKNWTDALDGLPRDLSGTDVEQLQLFDYHDYTLGQTLYDLGVNLEEYLVVSVLLKGDYIAEQKVAEITGIPRSTVRGRIDDAVAMDLIARDENGVALTELGRKLFVLMSKDASIRAVTGAPLSLLLCEMLDNLTLADGVTRPFKIAKRLRPEGKDA